MRVQDFRDAGVRWTPVHRKTEVLAASVFLSPYIVHVKRDDTGELGMF